MEGMVWVRTASAGESPRTPRPWPGRGRTPTCSGVRPPRSYRSEGQGREAGRRVSRLVVAVVAVAVAAVVVAVVLRHGGWYLRWCGVVLMEEWCWCEGGRG